LDYIANGTRQRKLVATIEKARETAATVTQQLGEGIGQATISLPQHLNPSARSSPRSLVQLPWLDWRR